MHLPFRRHTPSHSKSLDRESTVASTASSTSYTEANPPPRTHACLTLNARDKLKLIGFPQHVIDHVREVIKKTWSRGIETERSIHGHAAVEFKLSGRPWQTSCVFSVKRCPGTEAREMFCAVLSVLAGTGWHAFSASDVAHSPTEKDTLYFRYTSPPTSNFTDEPGSILSSPPTSQTSSTRSGSGAVSLSSTTTSSSGRSSTLRCLPSFFAVEFSEGDKLRVIACPSPFIMSLIHEILQPELQSFSALHHSADRKEKEKHRKDSSSSGTGSGTSSSASSISDSGIGSSISSTGSDSSSQADEPFFDATTRLFKLKSYPFYSDGDAAVRTRLLLLHILDSIQAQGWQLCAALDMTGGGESSGGARTWLFKAEDAAGIVDGMGKLGLGLEDSRRASLAPSTASGGSGGDASGLPKGRRESVQVIPSA